MTYIVTDPCIKCKFMDCVEVCPVDCFYEGENFLVISPDECIDCGVCEPECPVDAIKPDTEDEADGKWLKVNSEYAKLWPNITVKGANPHAGMGDDAWVVEKEGQHGFDVRSVTGFALLNSTVSDVYGDFVYLGKDEEHGWTTDVVLKGRFNPLGAFA